MMIIAFSENTSKILPRILCRKYRHCAPIVCDEHGLIMYQFINRKNIVKIKLSQRDITILRTHGWKFIYISPNVKINLDCAHAYSCVNLSKRALNIHSIFIQTPYALYKYLTHQ